MRLWSMEYIAWKVRKAYTYGTAARHAHLQTFSGKGCAERGRPDADHRGILIGVGAVDMGPRFENAPIGGS